MIGDRWGVTDDEVARRYPCDDVVRSPVLQAWRGVTVRTTPENLWPWVAQIRLAPYSYDWIDNLGRRSPQELRDLPEPAAGQPFTTAATRRLGRILTVSATEHITGRIAGTVISYVLVPNGDTTRLLMKIVAAKGRLTAPLLTVGDLVMARRQLLNLKRLAEQGAPTPLAQ
ncbi:MAG: polyketide cyclase [Pseudonocardiales bacterium]